MLWIGFDVGGTFIDFLALDPKSGELLTRKVPSPRNSLAPAIDDGVSSILELAQARPLHVGRVVHGTTVATNQLVERSGSMIGVITTAGFRDVLEIGRMRRGSLYDLYQDKIPPLAARDLRLEVHERVLASGEVVIELKDEEVETVVERLRRLGVEGIAACLINSHANPKHERRIADACARAGIACSPSHAVSGEYGEFERWSTATVNSYVLPKTAAYLSGLVSTLKNRGISVPLEIMQSSGGVISEPIARTLPCRLIESGPAAGVWGATTLGSLAGFKDLITLDMGGTSTDVSVVVDGIPAETSEYKLGGYPVRVLGLDIESIGAGGGSIALLDQAGELRVGPESAGSEPGPAAYGGGGTEPTVTDADVVLGYLDPDGFCGGDMPLHSALARQAIEEKIAVPLGVSIEQAALGIVHVAVVNMVGAIRRITTERGLDPRDFALVAYGGAGPVHGALVARELEIPEVVIFQDPGLLSAKGLLLADRRADARRTFVSRLDSIDLDELEEVFEQLQSECLEQLSRCETSRSMTVKRILELCYEGQQYKVPIPVHEHPITQRTMKDSSVDLDNKFKEIHGFVPTDRAPLIQEVRVTAVDPIPHYVLRPSSSPSNAIAKDKRRFVEESDGAVKMVDAYVLQRHRIPIDEQIEGPCLVEERYSTIVVGSGQSALKDEFGNIIIKAMSGGK